MFIPTNPYPTQLIYSNFQPLEVVSRYRDPQFQVAENYYLFFVNICKFLGLDTYMYVHVFG